MTIAWLPLAVFGLATWRISNMITGENGPWHIFKVLREHFGITHDDQDRVLSYPHTFFGELLSCVWCSSVWVGLFWSLVWFFLHDIGLILALPFVLSALAISLSHWLEKR